MEDSILNSVKTSCNVSLDNTDFDSDLITLTNSELARLLQLGVGPAEGFAITGTEETWTDLLGENSTYLNQVPVFIGLSVRLVFDPPVSGSVKESLTKTVDKLEWLINVAKEGHDLEEADAS